MSFSLEYILYALPYALPYGLFSGWVMYLFLNWLGSPAQRRKRAPRCSADHLHAVGRCKKGQ